MHGNETLSHRTRPRIKETKGNNRKNRKEKKWIEPNEKDTSCSKDKKEIPNTDTESLLL
jgi:hypothetical protein